MHDEEPFSVEVRRADGALLVTPAGELDLASAPVLEARIDERIDDVSHLVLDLSRLRFIDTSGMRLVLQQQAACARAGRRLSLVQGPPPVQRLFEIAGVRDRLPFVADADAALRQA